MSTRTPGTPVRRVLATTAAGSTAVLAGWAAAAPAAAQAAAQAVTASTPVTGMTPGRLGPTVVAVVALAGVVAGGLALRRSGGGRTGRAWAVAAVTLGLVGAGLGAFSAATADGGLGTGNGLGGAVVGVVLGLVAIALGGRALVRAREGSRV